MFGRGLNVFKIIIPVSVLINVVLHLLRADRLLNAPRLFCFDFLDWRCSRVNGRSRRLTKLLIKLFVVRILKLAVNFSGIRRLVVEITVELSELVDRLRVVLVHWYDRIRLGWLFFLLAWLGLDWDRCVRASKARQVARFRNICFRSRSANSFRLFSLFAGDGWLCDFLFEGIVFSGTSLIDFTEGCLRLDLNGTQVSVECARERTRDVFNDFAEIGRFELAQVVELRRLATTGAATWL